MENSVSQIAVDHYQKTFELTYEIWQERNKLFVYLVVTAGVGLLLLLRVPELDKLIVEAIISILKIEDPERISHLYSSFPFDVFLSVILVVVFYLMQKLYSTNLSVLRYYMYLGMMEDEIRASLNLFEDSCLFTREGSFYWNSRTSIQGVSKWSYVFVIAITLLSFIYLKIIGDIKLGNFIVLGIDLLLSTMIIVFFWGYSQSAWKLDTSRLPQKSKNISAGSKNGKIKAKRK